jgi:hypothetical protein
VALSCVETCVYEEIERCAGPFVKEVGKDLDSISRVSKHFDQTIIREMGVDMGRFGSAEQWTSWVGMCPDNNEPAGKRKSGHTDQGEQVPLHRPT